MPLTIDIDKYLSEYKNHSKLELLKILTDYDQNREDAKWVAAKRLLNEIEDKESRKLFSVQKDTKNLTIWILGFTVILFVLAVIQVLRSCGTTR